MEPKFSPRVESEHIQRRHAEANMSSTVLIIILVIILVGALPTWGHSRNWGYAPSGLLGTVLIVLLVLALMGRL
jgi:Zn-dependent protease with chaperone function